MHLGGAYSLGAWVVYAARSKQQGGVYLRRIIDSRIISFEIFLY